MIGPPPGVRIWIAAGITDLRCGFTGLSAAAQTVLEQDPFDRHVFVFRGRRGDLKRQPRLASRVSKKKLPAVRMNAANSFPSQGKYWVDQRRAACRNIRRQKSDSALAFMAAID
ncbi:MAG: IS66 family insertion sequence element accessory protein TnpB [Bryobacteraceae bacterium]